MFAVAPFAARPEAVAKRHGRGGRTARENVADLVDDSLRFTPARWPRTPSPGLGPMTRPFRGHGLCSPRPGHGAPSGTPLPCPRWSYETTK